MVSRTVTYEVRLRVNDAIEAHLQSRDSWVSAASFAEYTVVSEAGCVTIREDAPPDKASLMGCGVMTGVGAAGPVLVGKGQAVVFMPRA
jgi:Zn-dependent alcohol dehydrogenase